MIGNKVLELIIFTIEVDDGDNSEGQKCLANNIEGETISESLALILEFCIEAIHEISK